MAAPTTDSRLWSLLAALSARRVAHRCGARETDCVPCAPAPRPRLLRSVASYAWASGPCARSHSAHTPCSHVGHGLFHPRFAVVVGHHGRARQEVHGSIWTTEARHTLFFAGPVAPLPPASAAHTTQAGRPLTLPPRLRRLPRSTGVAGRRERCLDGTEEKARSSCPGWCAAGDSRARWRGAPGCSPWCEARAGGRRCVRPERLGSGQVRVRFRVHV